MKPALILLCLVFATPLVAAGFPPAILYNNLDTNAVGTAPDGWQLTELAGKPVWSNPATNPPSSGGPSLTGTNSFSSTNTFNTLVISNTALTFIHSWPGPSNSLDCAAAKWRFTATGNMAVSNLLNVGTAGIDYPSMLTVTNPWPTNVTLYVTVPGITTDDSARSYVVTNQSKRKLQFCKDDDGFYLVSRPFQ